MNVVKNLLGNHCTVLSGALAHAFVSREIQSCMGVLVYVDIMRAHCKTILG